MSAAKPRYAHVLKREKQMNEAQIGTLKANGLSVDKVEQLLTRAAKEVE